MTQQSEEIYRSTLETVCRYMDERGGGKVMSAKDVMGYTKECHKTVRGKYFTKGNHYVTIENFARKICKA